MLPTQAPCKAQAANRSWLGVRKHLRANNSDQRAFAAAKQTLQAVHYTHRDATMARTAQGQTWHLPRRASWHCVGWLLPFQLRPKSSQPLPLGPNTIFQFLKVSMDELVVRRDSARKNQRVDVCLKYNILPYPSVCTSAWYPSVRPFVYH